MKTTNEIKNDENFLCALELPESLSVYIIYTGGPKVKAFAFLKDKLLFEENSFKPSPMYPIDSINTCLSLLSFLTTQPGDTDDEYFTNYTPDQMKWVNSFECEKLKGLVNDFDLPVEDYDYAKEAQEYFINHFINN